MIKRIFYILALPVMATTSVAAVEPGDPVDYAKLAFYPDRWTKQGHSMELIPWKGKEIAFLTTQGTELDKRTMSAFVGHLDDAWLLYESFTGQSPNAFRMVDGRPTIAAVPGGGLTCGYGCGYVGATGIEMTHFYDGHYPKLQKNTRSVPHAYFYEMGRNYYTFGKKHDAFTTGFAVFMRYVCMDELRLIDDDGGTRKTIENAIDLYEQSDLMFLKTFSNAGGLSEKAPRLKVQPSDQPVMYASAMLQLWKTHGDDWLKAFYRQLATCPEADQKTPEGAQQQCLSWYIAASCAARKDLSRTFVDAWRLPLSEEAVRVLRRVDWRASSLKAATVLKALPDDVWMAPEGEK